jgi:hypothetical protein
LSSALPQALTRVRYATEKADVAFIRFAAQDADQAATGQV